MDSSYLGDQGAGAALCRHLGSSSLGARYFLRVHESGQGQLAVTAPVGEEQTGPTRWRTAARRLVTVVAVAALTIGLFWAYLLQSRTQPVNSDAAGMVLQGWDMLHGNLLLRGWVMADVSFYTFEVPLDGLISVVYGLRADVVHVAAAAEYALLVLFAALLAAGAGRDRRRGGREAWVRGLIAAGIMVAPGADAGRARAAAGARPHRHRRPRAGHAARRGPGAAPSPAARARDRAAGLPAADLGAARRSGRRVRLRAPARPGLRRAAGRGPGPAARRPHPRPARPARARRPCPGVARRRSAATMSRWSWRRPPRTA